jgi:hypothetical protein
MKNSQKKGKVPATEYRTSPKAVTHSFFRFYYLENISANIQVQVLVVFSDH